LATFDDLIHEPPFLATGKREREMARNSFVKEKRLCMKEDEKQEERAHNGIQTK